MQVDSRLTLLHRFPVDLVHTATSSPDDQVLDIKSKDHEKLEQDGRVDKDEHGEEGDGERDGSAGW